MTTATHNENLIEIPYANLISFFKDKYQELEENENVYIIKLRDDLHVGSNYKGDEYTQEIKELALGQRFKIVQGDGNPNVDIICGTMSEPIRVSVHFIDWGETLRLYFETMVNEIPQTLYIRDDLVDNEWYGDYRFNENTMVSGVYVQRTTNTSDIKSTFPEDGWGAPFGLKVYTSEASDTTSFTNTTYSSEMIDWLKTLKMKEDELVLDFTIKMATDSTVYGEKTPLYHGGARLVGLGYSSLNSTIGGINLDWKPMGIGRSEIDNFIRNVNEIINNHFPSGSASLMCNEMFIKYNDVDGNRIVLSIEGDLTASEFNSFKTSIITHLHLLKYRMLRSYHFSSLGSNLNNFVFNTGILYINDMVYLLDEHEEDGNAFRLTAVSVGVNGLDSSRIEMKETTAGKDFISILIKNGMAKYCTLTESVNGNLKKFISDVGSI